MEFDITGNDKMTQTSERTKAPRTESRTLTLGGPLIAPGTRYLALFQVRKENLEDMELPESAASDQTSITNEKIKTIDIVLGNGGKRPGEIPPAAVKDINVLRTKLARLARDVAQLKRRLCPRKSLPAKAADKNLSATLQPPASGTYVARTLKEMKTELIIRALVQTRCDLAAAARILGVGKTTLYRRVKEYQAAGLVFEPSSEDSSELPEVHRPQIDL